MLTDDVVFLSAHEPVMVGKAAVKPWLEGYLKAFKTHWDKPVQEFVVTGDWAFERYHTSQPTRLWPGVPSWRTRAGVSCSTITTRMANGAWRATPGAQITQHNRPRCLLPIWKRNGPPMFHAIRSHLAMETLLPWTASGHIPRTGSEMFQARSMTFGRMSLLKGFGPSSLIRWFQPVLKARFG